MVGITGDAVINAVGIGILSLRQSGIPTLLVIRGEGIFERTMLGCTGCNQCLCAAVIGQRVSCRSGESRIGFVNNECTLDIGNVVVSRSLSGRGDVVLAYVAADGIVAHITQFARQHVSRQVAALQTIVGDAEARSGIAVNDLFVLRGDGQRSLGDGYLKRAGDVLLLVAVGSLVINGVTARIGCGRQVGAVLAVLAYLVLEGEACYLTGSDERLRLAGIDESGYSLRQSNGSRCCI